MENKNDWFATIFLNPTKDIDNFVAAGLTSDNTVIYDKDYYKSIDAVKQKFTDTNGVFDENAFDKFYDSTLRTYNSFIQDSLIGKNIKNEWGMFSIDGDPKFMPTFGIKKVSNPENRSVGISSLYGEGEATRSMKEAAQDNYARDSQGRKLNWKPNDDDRRGLSFFNNRPLYYAKWEEDGYHILPDGREVSHVKGEYKLDEEGMPYVQELAPNQDVSGKELVSITDTLTVDGSTANKYDFLDSDGIDKSITGSVAKMIATVAPVLIPGVGEIYAYGLVAAHASTALASLAKVALETALDDPYDNRAWQLLNNIEAYTKSTVTDRSVSQKGRESFWNIENLAGLISDVATQGAQQRAIANGAIKFMKFFGYDRTGINLQREFIAKYGAQYANKFGKSLSQALIDGDIAEEFVPLAGKYLGAVVKNRKFVDKAARDASSLYMALTQTQSIVDSMKESGFSSPYTAMASLAAVVGFKKIMDSELGDIALKGLGLDDTSKEIKKSLLSLVKNTGEVKIDSQAGKLLWVRNTANKVADRVKHLMNDSEFMESALKEGAEEVSEEILQDTIMGSITALSWSLKQLGIDDGNKGTWSYLESNPLERYLSSFVGGAIGGPMNRGIDMLKNWNYYKQIRAAKNNKQDTLDFIDLVRKYGKEPLLKEIDKFEKKNLFPTTLTLESTDGNSFNPSKNDGESQNKILFDYLRQYVNYWDTLIHEEGLDVDDSVLVNEALNKDLRVTLLKDTGLGSEVINTFNDLLYQLANANLKYKELYYKTPDDQKANSKELSEVKKTADNIREQIKELREGVKASDFLDRALFKLNRSLNGSLYDADIFMYAKHKGINYFTLDDVGKENLSKEFEEYKKVNKNVDNLAYEVYKNAREILQPNLTKISTDRSTEYLKALRERLNALAISNSISGFEPLSNEELDKVLKAKRNGKTDDEIIALLHLNPNQAKLDEETKKKLVDNYFINEIQNERNTEATESLIRYYDLGLDPEFFGDLNRLHEVINILAELKKQYNYIDDVSREKVQTIIDKVNKLSINDLASNIANNLTDDINIESEEGLDYENLKDVFKSIYAKSKDTAEKDPWNEGELLTKITFSRSDDGYKVIFTWNYDEENSDVIELDSSNFKDVIITLLSSEGIDSTVLDAVNSKKIFHESLIGSSFDDVVKLINDANKLLENDGNDIIMPLLKTVSESVFGTDVASTYSEVMKLLTSSENITDFIIKNPNIKAKLSTLNNAIDLINAILLYSTEFKSGNIFNHQRIINELRQHSRLQPLVSISAETATEIGAQLQKISNAATLLIKLSDVNNETKLKENQIIHSKGVATWLRLLVSNELSSITVNSKSFFDKNDFSDGISDILLRAGSGVAISADELAKLEKELLTFEEYYFEKFNSLSDEDKNQIITAFSLIDVTGTMPTKLDKEFNLKSLDNESKIAYVLTMLISNPADFRSAYYEAIKSKDFDGVIPLYSQMLVVKEAISAFNGASQINSYLSKLVSEQFNKDEFFIPNAAFVSGSAGSGKTKVVAKLFKSILSKQYPDLVFKSYAIKQDRAKELSSVMGIKEENTKFGRTIYDNWFDDETKKELFEFLDKISSTKPTNDTQALTKEYIKDRIEYFKGKAHKNDKEVIVIDEFTHLSNFELALLGNMDNVFLLCLGDLKQEGFKGYLDKGGMIPKFSTPILDVSIRANNNHKKDNLNALSTILDIMLRSQVAQDAGKGNLGGAFANRALVESKGFFRYYEDSNGLVKGEKVVSKGSITADSIKRMIDGLKEGENIAYIYDNYNRIPKEIIDLVKPDDSRFVLVKDTEVQGSEYNYTIIDTISKVLDENDGPKNVSDVLSYMYTLLSRSKEGSVIIKNDNWIVNESSKYNTYTSDAINQDELKAYQEYIQQIGSSLELSNVTSQAPLKEGIPNEIGIPDINLNGKSPDTVINNALADTPPKNHNGEFIVYQSEAKLDSQDMNTNMASLDKNNSDTVKQYYLLKNLIFRSDEDLDKLFSRINKEDTYEREKFRECVNIFQKFDKTSNLYKSNRDEIIALIKGRKFYIKKLGLNNFVFYAKVGEWNIELGNITNPDEFSNKYKNELNNANINTEWEVKPSSLEYSKAWIEKGNYTYDNNKVSDFRKNNPWANFSDDVWIGGKEVKNSNVQVGYPVVLYSNDLFSDPKTYQQTFYDSIINNTSSNVVPLRTSLHGYTFKEYMKKWGSLYQNKSIRFISFSGVTQPVLIRKQLLLFKTFINAYVEKGEEEAKRALEKNPHDYQLYLKAIKNSNISAEDIQKILNDIKKTLDDFDKEWNDKLSQLGLSFNVDWNDTGQAMFSDLTKKFISDNFHNNIASELLKIKTLEDVKKLLKQDDNKKANQILEDISRFNELYETFVNLAKDHTNPISSATNEQGERVYTTLSPYLMDYLITSGNMPRFTKCTMLLHTLHSIVRNNNYNNKFLDVVSMAIDGTSQYKDGIWTNGVMANIKTNGFYKSVNTQEGLYFNSNIKQPSVRLKLKDIKLNEKPAEIQTSPIESEGKSPIDNNDSSSEDTTTETNSTVSETVEETAENTTDTFSSYLNSLTLPDNESKLDEVKKEISKLEANYDKNTPIEEFFNGITVIVDNTAYIVSKNTIMPLNNNNAKKLLPQSKWCKSIKSKSREDESKVNEFLSELDQNSNFDINIVDGKIVVKFLNGIFSLNGGSLIKEESEPVKELTWEDISNIMKTVDADTNNEWDLNEFVNGGHEEEIKSFVTAVNNIVNDIRNQQASNPEISIRKIFRANGETFINYLTVEGSLKNQSINKNKVSTRFLVLIGKILDPDNSCI